MRMLRTVMHRFCVMFTVVMLVPLSAQSIVECADLSLGTQSRAVGKTIVTRGGSSNDPFRARSSPSINRYSSKSSPQAYSSAERERAATKEMMESFLTRDSRNSFIARVYAILGGQLLVTAGSVLLFGLNPPLSQWMRQSGFGSSIPALSLGVSTIAWFVMCASADARRKSPLKWQMLALFTAGEALSVGFISSFYHFRSVVSAMLATAVASTTVSVYVGTQNNPKYDLSQWGQSLSSLGLIFLVYGLIQLLQMMHVLPAGFMPYSEMLYSLAGACLFSLYLAYHTKLIVAGKHSKYQISDKDYVFGAMTLYNDIINMFIYILRLIGEDKRGGQ